MAAVCQSPLAYLDSLNQLGYLSTIYLLLKVHLKSWETHQWQRWGQGLSSCLVCRLYCFWFLLFFKRFFFHFVLFFLKRLSWALLSAVWLPFGFKCQASTHFFCWGNQEHAFQTVTAAWGDRTTGGTFRNYGEGTSLKEVP